MSFCLIKELKTKYLFFFNSVQNNYVDIYEYNGSSWVRKGSRISSPGVGINFARSLDLSGDGLTVAVGADYYSVGFVST